MKMMMIAALVAAPLSAAAGPARAAEPPREESAAQQPAAPEGDEAATDPAGPGATTMERTQFADAQAPAPTSDAREEDKPGKRKSTGDKVLTGAAVVLGVAALAVTGLLVALFVN